MERRATLETLGRNTRRTLGLNPPRRLPRVVQETMPHTYHGRSNPLSTLAVVALAVGALLVVPALTSHRAISDLIVPASAPSVGPRVGAIRCILFGFWSRR